MKSLFKKNRNNFFSLGLLLVALAFFSACSKDDSSQPDNNASNPGKITSDITTDTILVDRGEGVDYNFCGYIKVKAKLTIEPGVTIAMCPESNISVEDEGALYAVGSADKPIVIEGKEHTKGYWGEIDFSSNNPDNQIAYAKILDGGGSGGGNAAAIGVSIINSAQLSITHSTIANSKNIGLFVDRGTTLSAFSENHFKNNGSYPVKIPFNQIGALDAKTDYGDNNGDNFIKIRYWDEPNTHDMTVAAANVPYYINRFVKVKAGLTLQPGTQFVMGEKATIVIEDEGFLNAEGTAEDSISIIGKVDAVGYWNWISIETNNPKNVLKYVTIANGGKGKSGYSDHATLGVYGFNHGQLTLQHCTIKDSYGWGLYVEDDATIVPQGLSALLGSNTFDNNGTGTNADCDGDCNVHIE